jgi:hypothetical protein
MTEASEVLEASHSTARQAAPDTNHEQRYRKRFRYGCKELICVLANSTFKQEKYSVRTHTVADAIYLQIPAQIC